MHKSFTVDEARELLPELRSIINQANEELSTMGDDVRRAHAQYEKAETIMDSADAGADVDVVRQCRADFQNAIEEVSRTQTEYVKVLTKWVDMISGKGVVLRDLQDGLLDFPASENGFDYFLCWKVDESDIDHWHPTNEGFSGRKPLVTLKEYF